MYCLANVFALWSSPRDNLLSWSLSSWLRRRRLNISILIRFSGGRVPDSSYGLVYQAVALGFWLLTSEVESGCDCNITCDGHTDAVLGSSHQTSPFSTSIPPARSPRSAWPVKNRLLVNPHLNGIVLRRSNLLEGIILNPQTMDPLKERKRWDGKVPVRRV